MSVQRPLAAPCHALELFTGAGRLVLGTHGAGFRHDALVEWNKDACATLRGISRWKVIRRAQLAANCCCPPTQGIRVTAVSLGAAGHVH